MVEEVQNNFVKELGRNISERGSRFDTMFRNFEVYFFGGMDQGAFYVANRVKKSYIKLVIYDATC